MSNYFTSQDQKKMLLLASRFRFHQKSLAEGIKTGGVNYTVAVHNIERLLGNEDVAKMILSARKKIFSRGGQRKWDSRYGRFIKELAREVASDYKRLTDFSEITRFTKMLRKVRSYVREGSQATSDSKRIKKGLRQVLAANEVGLETNEMAFHLLGSVMFGDAAEYSDIDGDYIVLARDEQYDDSRKDVIDSIEIAIDEHFIPDGGFNPENQIRDNPQIIDLSEYAAILTDIEGGITNDVEDYKYARRLFHPYDWLLQGVNPLRGSTVNEEMKEIKIRMKKTALKDPLFEFLLCYSMLGTIRKRKDNLSRE
tara:strand:- start:110 stop:1042 length:933 start_codon:yes stop_codon:yes gene_type:complete